MCVDACVMLPLVMVLQSSIPSGAGALVIGLAGGAFLFWLGLQSFRAGSAPATPGRGRGSRRLPPFLKSVLTQLMNPYAYIFWGTVGFAFVREGFEAHGLQGGRVVPRGFLARRRHHELPGGVSREPRPPLPARPRGALGACAFGASC